MMRWILGGRDTQGVVEKNSSLYTGEEQPKNPYTELQVLKGHFDIVRYLVQIDNCRFASAGDDGLVLVWNVETGEQVMVLRGHTQQITALVTYPIHHGDPVNVLLITASSDRSLCLWDVDTGARVQNVPDLQSSVRCLLVLDCQDVWLSGGNDLCVWSRSFQKLATVEHHSDTGVTAMLELPSSYIAAAVDREIVIYELTGSPSDANVSITPFRYLSNHRDYIRSLIKVSDKLFASGSHMGELILWDSVDWTIQANETIALEERHGNDHDGQPGEIRVATPMHSETSVQHLDSNGELLVAAVGSGLYVYNVQERCMVAYKRSAHDSGILHAKLMSESTLMSCSEDGSLKMWELQALPLPAEPTSAGFFGMWTFGRSSKQSISQKRMQEFAGMKTLEFYGDLIAHSGAVQMFLNFGESGLVTCSTDHLIIVWRDGELMSQKRSLMLFKKLEECQGI